MREEVDLSKSVAKLKILGQEHKAAETNYQELKKSVLNSLCCPLCKHYMSIRDHIEVKRSFCLGYPIRYKTGVTLTCYGCDLSTGACKTEEEAIEQFLIIQEALKQKEKENANRN